MREVWGVVLRWEAPVARQGVYVYCNHCQPSLAELYMGRINKYRNWIAEMSAYLKAWLHTMQA